MLNFISELNTEIFGHLMENDFSTDLSSFVTDQQYKRPPSVLYFGAIASIALGALIGLVGLYGEITSKLASTNAQYAVGFIGYLLSAILPIIFFQVFDVKHKKLAKNNKNEPYDNYAGINMHNNFKKVLAVGLIMAAFSVWVFLQPIAEKFA